LLIVKTIYLCTMLTAACNQSWADDLLKARLS